MNQFIWLFPPDAYEGLAPERIHEASLTPGGIYTAIFSLNHAGESADYKSYQYSEYCIGFNAKLNSIGGIALSQQVDFSVLDSDFCSQGPRIEANILDGIMDRSGMEPRHWSATHVPTGEFIKKEVRTGFFIEYNDEHMDDIIRAKLDIETELQYA